MISKKELAEVRDVLAKLEAIVPNKYLSATYKEGDISIVVPNSFNYNILSNILRKSGWTTEVTVEKSIQGNTRIVIK